MLTTRDTMSLHLGMKLQITQKLRRNEEVLARVFLTGDIDHALVHHALVARVHALVDFVDDAEGRAREVLQRHEVEDGRDGALAARLALRVEDGKGFVFAGLRVSKKEAPDEQTEKCLPESDLDLNRPLFEIFVFVHSNLSRTSNLCEIVRKPLADGRDEFVQARLPLLADLLDFAARCFQVLVYPGQVLLRSSDFHLALQIGRAHV